MALYGFLGFDFCSALSRFKSDHNPFVFNFTKHIIWGPKPFQF